MHPLPRIESAAATVDEAMLATEKHFPELTCLYDSIVNDFIHETLRTHNRNVAVQFADQSRYYDVRKIERELEVTVQPLFYFLIAHHDIGKPIAKQIYGNTELQTGYNRPLFLDLLIRSGFSANEIRLADALVSHDDLGRFLQKKISLVEAEKAFRTRALMAGFGDHLAAYFQLQLLYYISDSTAHDWIRQNYFERDAEGRLWPKSRADLEELIQKLL